MIRLQKLISQYGYASRRKAESLIQEGRVKVNGVRTKRLGQKILENAVITIDDHVINRDLPKIYLALNKPPGYLCSKRDPFGRKRIYDLLEKKYNDYGAFCVGRLDFMTAGLIFITNDGYFAQVISHPSNGIIKKYEVVTDKRIPYNLIAQWKNGIYTIEGEKYRISDFKKTAQKRVLITLCEGKKREIRRLFESININIVSLTRIAIGSVTLDNLLPGSYRMLTKREIESFFHENET